MRFKELLTAGAERDPEDIHAYFAGHDSPTNAEYALDGNLAAFPERGSRPRELLAPGIREYRLSIFKPYRVIYRATAKQAIVYLIADGRRDMQSLLSRRLLTA